MAQSVSPRFCLIAPDTVKAAVETGFEPALATGLVEALILPVAQVSEGAAEYGAALAKMAARHRAALLVVDDVAFAAEIGAGVVLTQMPDDLQPTRARLGGDAIVGTVSGVTRHAGLEAAQAGVEFVGLGNFDLGFEGQELEELVQLVTWWDEMIEIPCVAFGAATPEAAVQLLEAGADTVALNAALWATGMPAATLRNIAGQIKPGR